jgi:hypothetical protein
VQVESSVQTVPLLVPCTQRAGSTWPGGFVPQPVLEVVNESSAGRAEQQSQVGGMLVLVVDDVSVVLVVDDVVSLLVVTVLDVVTVVVAPVVAVVVVGTVAVVVLVEAVVPVMLVVVGAVPVVTVVLEEVVSVVVDAVVTVAVVLVVVGPVVVLVVDDVVAVLVVPVVTVVVGCVAVVVVTLGSGHWSESRSACMSRRISRAFARSGSTSPALRRFLNVPRRWRYPISRRMASLRRDLARRVEPFAHRSSACSFRSFARSSSETNTLGSAPADTLALVSAISSSSRQLSEAKSVPGGQAS